MSTLDERLNERRQREEHATTWRPQQHGSTLIGTLEKMDQGETEYGTSEVAHIRDNKGKLWGVWLFHTVLRNEWDEADPTLGDEVGIVYFGERDGDPYSYHAYAVEVERPEEMDVPPEHSLKETEGESASFEGTSTLDDQNGELPN